MNDDTLLETSPKIFGLHFNLDRTIRRRNSYRNELTIVKFRIFAQGIMYSIDIHTSRRIAKRHMNKFG